MSRSIDIGAPSLTGKGANDLVSKAFAASDFPLTLQAKNHMPQDAVFPEAGGNGLFLRHVASANGSEASICIASIDVMHRLASSVEQIAELNKYARAITFSVAGEKKEAKEPVSEPVKNDPDPVLDAAVQVTDEPQQGHEEQHEDDGAQKRRGRPKKQHEPK